MEAKLTSGSESREGVEGVGSRDTGDLDLRFGRQMLRIGGEGRWVTPCKVILGSDGQQVRWQQVALAVAAGTGVKPQAEPAVYSAVDGKRWQWRSTSLRVRGSHPGIGES